MSDKHLYKVIFQSQGQVYEVYARAVRPSSLLGFVEVEELVFGERSKLVVDPSEDRLKSEFDGVTRTMLPLHSVLRIDEVEKQGVARVTSRAGEGGRITPIPFPLPTNEPRK